MRPRATKGISLFLIQSSSSTADGSLGARMKSNPSGVRAQAGHARLADLHHDDGRQAARLGSSSARNRGMLCIVQMMHQAASASALKRRHCRRAYQQALAYAQERRQGRALVPKVRDGRHHRHPDVKRMLLQIARDDGGRPHHLLRHRRSMDVFGASRRTPRCAPTRPAGALLTPIAKALDRYRHEVAYLGVQIQRHGFYRGDPAPPSIIAA